MPRTRRVKRWRLAWCDGQGVARALSFSEADMRWKGNRLILGRSPRAAHLVVEDPRISRAHAALVFEHGEMFVEDLGSKNGTSVNGKRLIGRGRRLLLRHGDGLLLGGMTMIVSLER
ncbi:MAG TPA: FHA domain-containing protein [Verrucomicrobiae bacterium]|nr:FHA domain-containing protein [Verrucomicrobiae bacterium]